MKSAATSKPGLAQALAAQEGQARPAAPAPPRSGARLAETAALFSRIISLLRIPAPEKEELLRRIRRMEREVILPIKAAGILMILHSFYFSPWIGNVLGYLEIAVENTQYFLWIYIGVNLLVAGVLLRMKKLPLPLVQWVVFVSCLVDGIFLASLTLVTGGYDSILYWLFLALIVRGAVSVPQATSQIMLNLTLSACYALSSVIGLAVAENLPEEDRSGSGLSAPLDNPAQALLLRMVLLLMMTLCCYGVQVLLKRQRNAEDEAREFASRERQLRSAGRLAGEFAHQIKNPLAIINNAAFSLQRALKQGQTNVSEQIQIIQEEVQRSDRIVTEIMGYAQLTEGRVERLDLLEELNLAIERVFPPAAGYPVKLVRRFDAKFPRLLMQRRHLYDAFANVLQNAREALNGRPGTVEITARRREDNSVEVTIRDDGVGIPRDKHERIFEAYYTSKPKGTGLGLASVKHNLELYGGSVRVQSELGKGATFTLLFPARA